MKDAAIRCPLCQAPMKPAPGASHATVPGEVIIECPVCGYTMSSGEVLDDFQESSDRLA